ncbi:GNAT family N-acetyltransferase [Acidocella aminolytica]|jgi:RimJ/RimL family protein N-acetyltransferase|uniref:Acetyltransferase n=1 Tax=Acidocella aminolytica 101 = DSM 11237 TaxID=1120923 RepID=A0A0D6PCB7_9PROT|nr:GNAT family N-acetyltransferase [Acidocella aminolytica]GAN79001.1 acetyltransferase [Acidocella aminolytica 101 = DSM 11237]GBQ38382.1 acetyltransferase [Acidocella aminolytica 101 = DSM 11237]SHF37477.1 Protein N-acetyltransferase, RimJ/RimL family [Acidocella aminolytica 101 = DSM 11237]
MSVTWAWVVETARLRMTPVGYWDLPDLIQLKSDPRAFALMLGGVRSPVQTAEELAQDIQGWGKNGYGMWAVRAKRGKFLGITALMNRADGLGVALRFAFYPEARGFGLAREAASAALIYAHDTAHLPEVIAVAREDNYGSREVLSSIGMSRVREFNRNGNLMIVYQSIKLSSPRVNSA